MGFKGVCTDQLAILLEYVYFDFVPIGTNELIHSLAEFLSICERSSCDGIDTSVFVHVAMDVATGLQYLHQKNIAHRDLKPANVLVSNPHFRDLRHQEQIELMSKIKPLICKLTDFGESRSNDIHTNHILTSKTVRVDRGMYCFDCNYSFTV